MQGIVLIHIDAVEDAEELAVHIVDDALQPFAELGMVQLPGIGGRNGADGVRHHHGAFHQVDVVPAFIMIDQRPLVPAVVSPKSVYIFSRAYWPW